LSTQPHKTEIKSFCEKKTLNLGGKAFALDRPQVMGILNVTPDSFYDGGRYTGAGQLEAHAGQMLANGAAILDVGGHSTRPGAHQVPEGEEIARVVGAIKTIIKAYPAAVISVDTFRASVAQAAVAEGALLVNDVSGGQLDPNMFSTVAQLQVPYVMMHMRGTPATMKSLTAYDDLMAEVLSFFGSRLAQLRALGVADVLIDPGFGFAKNVQQNFAMLRHMAYFKLLECPLLVGLSRKSMIYKTLAVTAQEALNGTTALHMLALQNGANILRVHDVKEAMQAIELYTMTLNAKG